MNKSLSQILAELNGYMNTYSSLVAKHAPSLKFLNRDDLIEIYGKVLNQLKDCITESQKVIANTEPAKKRVEYIEKIIEVEKIVEVEVPNKEAEEALDKIEDIIDEIEA